jgi:SulP family sulfate permease
LIPFAEKYIEDIKKEFSGYGAETLKHDAFAGVTVAAVALPLAIAFGVGSGADAASGLISAVLSAFIMGTLAGASFQISGPTGAMTAILMPLAARYGMEGVLLAGALSGLVLIAAGILRLGKIICYLPSPVISGFTSGIAVIIAFGQAGNLFGVEPSGSGTIERFVSVISQSAQFNYYALFIGLSVIAVMAVWPKRWNEKAPSSLAALIIAAAMAYLLKMPVELVGDIPRTLIHESRIGILDLITERTAEIAIPAISIAALGMVETLLCAVAGSKMTGEDIDADRELVAQGIGNFILPFFGGVPSTAAIARSSVAIKSGGRTRAAVIIQGTVLLLSMFLLAPVMSKIPLSALAGVLIVTAWKMNDAHGIHYIFSRGFRTGAAKYLITMIATVLFSLTTAIAAGAIFAMLILISELSELEVSVNSITAPGNRNAEAVYITGPIFFGAIDALESGLDRTGNEILVISLRGVPYIDTSGAQSLYNFCKRKKAAGASILFAAANRKVRAALDRGGITVMMGETAFFNNVIDAVAVVERLHNL